MVSVAIVGAAASSGDGLGLVHLRLVRVIVDIVLTLGRRTTLGNQTLARRSCANRRKLWGVTVGRWMMELLEVTVCSPSCIMAISLLLSSEASARLLTELL